MITRNFIEKVHEAFDELNYHETKELNIDKFEDCAIDTLEHCKDLTDAQDTIRMFQFCLKKWSKIERMFRKKLDIFNEYPYEGNSLISLVSDEEAVGTFYITNGINRTIKEMLIVSHSFDEGILELEFKNGCFSFGEDYYLKYSKMSAEKMKLFDNSNDKCLCNIVLSDKLGIFLENNLTKYELIVYDDFIGVYDKDYINSLSDTDIIDTENLVADIEWDIIEKNSDYGVAKLNVYKQEQDLEIFLYFASSTFLIFQKYLQSNRAMNYMIMSSWIRR